MGKKRSRKRSQIVRSSPRISVNKLGEFLTAASPTRRRSILKAQKTPPDVIVARYRKAITPIASFLKRSGQDPAPVADAIARLESAPAKTQWTEHDNVNTAQALKLFLTLAESLPFTDIRYTRAKSDMERLSIGGVDISVRPDFILKMKRRGKRCVGAVKLHFIKSEANALTKPAQEYVATLCHKWLEENIDPKWTPTQNICLSVDIFRQRIVKAPKAVIRRLTDVENACLEIASLWGSV